MKRTWTIIGDSDVAASFRWYQSLFGRGESAPAHDYAPPGNGLLLFPSALTKDGKL